ncbi:GspH/FimT family protein [Indiicoccus explosivorum]|uniref:GspH/FimT family protein n=1 Tax=Indiicoccus explosivorum TaxID=1917864 RepID=UPI00138FFE7B|nr:GspH/FimT family pseudopilin [Indiicoccus explosivorum]
MQHQRCNRGFTLLETLLVLTILMAVSFGVPVYAGQAAKQEETRFFDLLIGDILSMQGESYRNGEWTELHFGTDGGSYTVSKNYSTVLVTRQMPATVRMDKTSYLKNIRFSPQGNVEAAGTIRFSSSGGVRVLTVHLGKGRVVLSE